MDGYNKALGRLRPRFDAIDLLVIYIDGMQFGEHQCGGCGSAGHKHILGLQQGATENAVVEDLLGAVSGAWSEPDEALVRD